MIKKSKKKVGLKDQATVAALINDLEDSTLKAVNNVPVVANKLKIVSQDASVTINTSQDPDATTVNLHATGGGVAGVASVNGLVGDVGISGINPVIIGQTGNNVTVNVDTGVRTINTTGPNSAGNFQINAGTNVTVSSATNGVTISSTGGGGTAYRYESVSLMTYITNACFSQGISFKDFLVGKVPLFYPIETLFKNSNGIHANNPIPVGSDTIAVTYPMRITYPYTSSQIGLINTRLANAVSIKIDAYMEPQDGGVPRTNHYERKVNIEFLATTQPVAINPFGENYFNGIGMCSKLDTDEDWAISIANGRNIETGTEAPALDMFGYPDITAANSYRHIKSLQVSEFKPGYLDATGILVARIIFEDIVLIKKYAYGV